MSRGGGWRRLLAPSWSRRMAVAEVRSGRGIGLGRAVLAAVVLALAMDLLVLRVVDRLLAEAPTVVAQLPALGLRDGKLWTEPPLAEPLILLDRAGREFAILDPAGRTRLEERSAVLMVTRTRLLVKGAQGQIQAFPLGRPGQGDVRLGHEDLLGLVQGLRWTIIALALPFLFVLGLALLAAQLGLAGILAHVPDRIYRLQLDGSGRLRLASLGLVPSTLFTSAAMLLGLSRGLPLLALSLTLAWMLASCSALSDTQADGED